MKLSIAAESGAVTVFDPQAWPSAGGADSVASMEESGRLLRIGAGGGAGERVAVYAGDELPAMLRPHLERVREVPLLRLSSGRLRASAGGCLERLEAGRGAGVVPEGVEMRLGAGDYEGTLYRVAYPEGYIEGVALGRMTRAQALARRWMAWLGPAGVIGALGILAGFFVVSRGMWLKAVLPAGLVALASPMVLGRSGAYRSGERVREAMREEFPGQVLELRLVPAGRGRGWASEPEGGALVQAESTSTR